MLGGFGMPYELGLAAFEALRDNLLQDNPTPSASAIEEILIRPLTVGQSKRRYRFPYQRAQRLSAALRHLHSTDAPTDPPDNRDW
ncbi:hypothetical protein, partial [Microbacterium sp. ISL-103]|uniref:hypothetical protein n=1 Tax=Microbacterium sp. ISL-103 TaxID=2819156 RepID=UPI001BE8CF32